MELGFYLNNGVKYNGLRQIDLILGAFNGNIDKNISSSDSKVNFMLTALGDGLFTARYHNVETAISFAFLKSNPNVSLIAEDIMYGDDLIVKVICPDDAGGNLTVKLLNQNQTKEIESPISIFNFTDLNANYCE